MLNKSRYWKNKMSRIFVGSAIINPIKQIVNQMPPSSSRWRTIFIINLKFLVILGVDRGHSRSFEVIRGQSRSFEVIRSHSRSFEVISRIRASSGIFDIPWSHGWGQLISREVKRGYKRSSDLIFHPLLWTYMGASKILLKLKMNLYMMKYPRCSFCWKNVVRGHLRSI